MPDIHPDPSDQQWRRAATTFLLFWHPKTGPGTNLQLLRRRHSPEAWAIEHEGQVLGITGEWEDEPQPSSRDDAFFRRCRWPSAEAALAFARANLDGTVGFSDPDLTDQGR